MKFFLNSVLGWPEPPNQSAIKGTIVHKVLEILGKIKLTQQNALTKYTDELYGEIDINEYNLDHIIECIFACYTKTSNVKEWGEDDYKECHKLVYKALNFENGMYDPRNKTMVDAEVQFDIPILEPWAMYNYELADGQKVEGFLAIKGTIDQITKVDDDTYEILDWKTGRRWDWAKDKEKDYTALCNDHQLRMYHYAAKKLYPEIKHVIVTIYFIKDGGPFPICFTDSDLKVTEEMLRNKFEDIKATEIPKQNRSWKCSKFCHYGRSTFENTSIQPIIEKRPGQVTPMGQPMTKCEQAKYCCSLRPMDSVIKNMTAPNFTPDYYQQPGAVPND